MRTIEKLVKAFPPPADAIERGDEDTWPEMQNRIGSVLPRDYKDFINAYGSVYLCNFLVPFNPFSGNVHINLVRQMAAQLSALRVLKTDHGAQECPYPLWFEPGGLLPWAGTDNGDVLYWSTHNHPDQWTVVLNESRGPRYEEFKGSMTDFLLAFLSSELRTEICPDDLADGERTIKSISPAKTDRP